MKFDYLDRLKKSLEEGKKSRIPDMSGDLCDQNIKILFMQIKSNKSWHCHLLQLSQWAKFSRKTFASGIGIDINSSFKTLVVKTGQWCEINFPKYCILLFSNYTMVFYCY